jgi:anti-sigma B factor antagonist
MSFGLNCSLEGDSLVLWGAGEFDLAGREVILDAASPALVQGQTVIIDLHEVTFIDASGLRTLATCAKAAACSGAQFAVRQARGQVADLLKTTGFAGLIVSKTINDRASAPEAPKIPDANAGPSGADSP